MPADLESRPPQSEHFFRSGESMRLARELQDSTLKPLAALDLELGLLKSLGPAKATTLVGKCEESVEDLKRQIAALASGAGGR